MILSVTNLSCVMGTKQLFSNISINIDRGQILQVTGANGAGKTSMLRQLCGLLPATDSQFLWCGEPCTVEDYQDDIIYFGHRLGIDERLSVIENMDWMRATIQQPNDLSNRQLLENSGLQNRSRQIVSRLSAGQKKRLALCRLYLSQTPLWVLDEPFSALDQAAITQLQHIFETHLNAGNSIIFTSHQALGINTLPLKSITLGDR